MLISDGSQMGLVEMEKEEIKGEDGKMRFHVSRNNPKGFEKPAV